MGVLTHKRMGAWDYVGYGGSLLVVSFPSLGDIEQWLRVGGMVLGLVLVILSIRHKRLEIKKFKRGPHDTPKKD